MLQASLHVTSVHTCGLSVQKLSFKGCTTAFPLDTYAQATFIHLVFFSSCLFSLNMPRFHVNRVQAIVWKWLCRCPDVIGPIGDVSGDDEFVTPPTSLAPSAEDEDKGVISSSSIMVTAGDAQQLLSPA